MSKNTVWIDTNVIIRFITADHPEMTMETADLMQKAETGQITLKVAAIIVAECCWVLQSAHYNFSSHDIATVLISFINADGIETEEKETVLKALEQYSRHSVDFIDAYLAEHARSVGPGYVTTFNSKHFTKLEINFDRPANVKLPF